MTSAAGLSALKLAAGCSSHILDKPGTSQLPEWDKPQTVYILLHCSHTLGAHGNNKLCKYCSTVLLLHVAVHTLQHCSSFTALSYVALNCTKLQVTALNCTGLQVMSIDRVQHTAFSTANCKQAVQKTAQMSVWKTAHMLHIN